ncbi:MAG TPA: hypothetical protein ENK83_08440, partial [Aliiroseovarius sp.]|nr:hypothetical protein [Aliiroseovarius sp.]
MRRTLPDPAETARRRARALPGKGLPRATLALAAALLLPHPAWAHVSERAIVLLLPTDVYRLVGVLAVIATIALTLFLPDRASKWFPERPAFSPPPGAGLAAHIGFALVAGLIALGYWGPHNPLGNLLPLTLFTFWWLLLLSLAGVVGDFWKAFNPWAAPLAWLKRGKTKPLPAPLQTWPALASYLVFAIYYLSDLAPVDPDHLAKVALAYWLIHFAFALRYGSAWLQQSEGFAVLFSLAGRLSPMDWAARRLVFPGARLIIEQPSVALGVFVVTFLAIGSFDGLNETFLWMGLIGINPLEFPGRSAVIWENRIGLLGAVTALNLLFVAVVWLGLILAGGSVQLRAAWPKLALTLLPIAMAYHFAHYLPSLLVGMQYWVLALNDPLENGAHLLGMDWHVTTGFLNQHSSVRAIWLAQAGAIVIGHMLSILLSHAVAL